MKVIYDDFASASWNQINCVGYAVALQTAYETLGFRTYHIRGEVTTANGGWTPHSWVGVVIGGQMVYFDTNLPGKYKAKGNYFGVLPKNATWYRNAEIMKLYILPESLIYYSGGTCAIDAKDRTDYRSVAVSADYRPEGYATGLKGFKVIIHFYAVGFNSKDRLCRLRPVLFSPDFIIAQIGWGIGRWVCGRRLTDK